MMSRPQFHPETLVRNINMRTYIDRFGYRHAKERAWMDTVGLMYEEIEYYISAPGTPDDILHELKPKARRMKVDTLSGRHRVGYIKGGMIADIFEEKDSLYVTFSETGQYIYEPKLGPQLFGQRQCCGFHCSVIKGLPDHRRQIQEQLHGSMTTWILWNRTHKR